MRRTKIAQGLRPMVAALAVAAVVPFASSYAQSNKAPLLNAVGSSAAFNAVALAARCPTSGSCTQTSSGVCGTHNWTKKSTASGVDNRSTSISAVTGNIWIVWDDNPEPSRTVCAYLSVDSIVGNRLFMAAPRGAVSIPSSAIGEAGDNIECNGTAGCALFPADEALPQSIWNDLTEASGTGNSVFNAAPTDIRPEDAKFATTRALNALTSNRSGLGYGPGPIGQTILSEFSTKSTQVVDFNISGTDPITGQSVLSWASTNVGAQVMMILVNSQDTSSAGLGNAAFNNVDRFVLGRVQDGTLTRTRDLIPSTGLGVVPLHILNREPLSGTFNTMEFCVPRSIEQNLSQEDGVDPSQPNNNPLNLTLADGATRQRVVGTGEMTSEIGLIQDSIGYAFWSFGNVSGIVSTAKYLTVDGVDPIQATYTGGTLPTCNAPCPGALTFPNVVNGSYPIWNVLRLVSNTPVPSGINSLISAAQTQVSNIPDFVPSNSLQVFRSHFLQAGVSPSNGHRTRSKEAGGDMGGAVLTVQADLDNITDTGKELVGLKQ